MKKIFFAACIVFSVVSTNANAAYFDGFQKWFSDIKIVVNRGTRPRNPKW